MAGNHNSGDRTPRNKAWMANLATCGGWKRAENLSSEEIQAISAIGQLRRWNPHASPIEFALICWKNGYNHSFGVPKRRRYAPGERIAEQQRLKEVAQLVSLDPPQTPEKP